MLDGLEQQTDMLERHVRVLNAVIEAEPIGIVTLADVTGIAQHQVRYSLRKLEEESIIEPSHDGAKLTGDATTIITEQDERLDEVISHLEALEPINED